MYGNDTDNRLPGLQLRRTGVETKWFSVSKSPTLPLALPKAGEVPIKSVKMYLSPVKFSFLLSVDKR